MFRLTKKKQNELDKYIETRNKDREGVTAEAIYRAKYLLAAVEVSIKEISETNGDIDFVRLVEKFYDIMDNCEKELDALLEQANAR